MPANNLFILVKAPYYKLTAVISGCCENRDSRIWAWSQPPTSLSSGMQFLSYVLTHLLPETARGMHGLRSVNSPADGRVWGLAG